MAKVSVFGNHKRSAHKNKRAKQEFLDQKCSGRKILGGGTGTATFLQEIEWSEYCFHARSGFAKAETGATPPLP